MRIECLKFESPLVLQIFSESVLMILLNFDSEKCRNYLFESKIDLEERFI